MPLTFETRKAHYETSSETHSEILEKLSKLAQKYNLGKCSAEELFAFCKKARGKANAGDKIARLALQQELRRAEINDAAILNQIDNIDTYIITDPKFVDRPFTTSDAKFISEGLINNPDEFIYHIVTNKTLDENLSQSEYLSLIQQLNNMLEVHGQSYSKFSGGHYIDFDNLHHVFSNPRVLPRNDWFYYSLGNNTEGFLTRELTKDRVYLHPKLENWIFVWNDLIQKLEENEQIKTNGFQTKIPNFFNIEKILFQRVASQSDRILFYFGENARSEALKIISEYVSAHPQYFEPCHSFACPLLNDKGEILEGAFTSSEISSGNNSFNGIQAKIVESLIESFALKWKKENGETPTKSDIIKKISTESSFKATFEKYLVDNYKEESIKFGFRADNIAFTKD